MGAVALQKNSSEHLSGSPLLPLIQGYMRYYAEGSGHTARAKRLDVGHFMQFLTKYRGFSKAEKLLVRDWDHSAVQRFVDYSLQHGESPSTVARRLATIKHMGRTLAEKMPGFVNPAKEVKTPKVSAPAPKAINVEELNEIRSKASGRATVKRSFIRERNKFLFEFLLDTGIRADEVRSLRLSQIDDDLQWIKNVRTKGRRYRNVYITSALRPLMREYLEIREKELKKFYAKLNKNENKKLPLFISIYKAKAGDIDTFLMGPKTIWRAINELSEETALHPHLLRHSYALDLLDTSNDIRLVAQALGHSDVRITMRYTEREEKQIAAALEKSRKKARN